MRDDQLCRRLLGALDADVTLRGTRHVPSGLPLLVPGPLWSYLLAAVGRRVAAVNFMWVDRATGEQTAARNAFLTVPQTHSTIAITLLAAEPLDAKRVRQDGLGSRRPTTLSRPE